MLLCVKIAAKIRDQNYRWSNSVSHNAITFPSPIVGMAAGWGVNNLLNYFCRSFYAGWRRSRWIAQGERFGARPYVPLTMSFVGSHRAHPFSNFRATLYDVIPDLTYDVVHAKLQGTSGCAGEKHKRSEVGFDRSWVFLDHVTGLGTNDDT